MNKQVKLYLLIIIIVLLVTMISFSFAFIGNKGVAINSNTSVSGNIVNTNSYLSLTYPTSTAISLTADRSDFSSTSTGIAKSTTSDITMTLSTTNNVYTNGVTCNYSLYYTPVTIFNASYGSGSSDLTELELSGNSTLNNVVQSTLSSFKIDNKAVGTKNLLGSASISTSSGSETKSIVWHITMNLYNLDIDQSGIAGQSPSGTFSIETTSCEVNS